MVDGVGLAGQNLEILNTISAAVVGLGMPYIILGDWNMPPDALAAHPWIASIGKIAKVGEDTMILKRPMAGWPARSMTTR